MDSMTEDSKTFPAGGVAGIALLVVVLVGAGLFLGRDDGLLHEWERREQVNPMEFTGRWLGMTVVSCESRTAAQWGVPDSTKGVLVIEISYQDGWRARYAGVDSGDVITAIEDMKVKNLEGFHRVTSKVDTAGPVMLDVNRGGQAMTLILAGSTQSSQDSSSTTQQQTLAQPATTPSSAAQPVVGGAAQGPYYTTLYSQGSGLGSGRSASGQQANSSTWGQIPQSSESWYKCPIHGTRWPGSSVHPNYRCPMCNGALAPCAAR